MKNSIKIMAGAAIVLAAASCGRLESFDHQTFATFNEVDYSVDETVGQVKVGVSLYNPTKSETKITVKAVDGKAVNGTDYEIVSPASGVLTFAPGQGEQEIIVGIKNHSGEFTGSLDFALELESATAGVVVGNLNTAYVTIKDLDHPLHMFIGVWTGQVSAYANSSYNMNVTIAPNDDDETFSSLIVQDLDPYFAANGFTAAKGYNQFIAIANETKDQLTIPAGQPNGYVDETDGAVCLLGLDGPDLATGENIADIVFTLSSDGRTLTCPNCFGPYANGFWEVIRGPIVLKKK